MSGTEDRDLLAAEYALGTLDADEARRAEDLMRRDAAFRAAVEAWERRLAPLAGLVPPSAPPPELWSRIEASTRSAAVSGPSPAEARRLDPSRPHPVRRVAFWRATTAGSLALAAALAAFAYFREPPQQAAAVLAPPGGAPVFVAEAAAGGLRLRPAGTVQVATGKDLELWALRAGATRPESLGVLPAGGKTITSNLPPGTQLLVSLEPQGGSPTGQPTGPVVSAGKVALRE
ncbi:MAG: anti-sigma factor [Acetobacteraceae bacterium]|nr:anti-sigma factor [Acetobacteraceae bacterium]